MRLSPRSLRFLFALAPLLALALTACAGNASNDPHAAETRTALPPPEMTPPAAPATDASGKPLVEQALSNDAVGAPGAEAPGSVDHSCTTDADCAVKDVGSCCGYSPACVNAGSPTFPEQVKAECAKNDMMSTCGFREIAGCTCVEGRCAAAPDGAGVVR